MATSLTGTRIRDHRRAQGLRQTALAEAAGISPSYLNLIEHNKRNVSEKVLGALAQALDLDPADLADQTESALASELRLAASQLGSEAPDSDQAVVFGGHVSVTRIDLAEIGQNLVD